MRFELVGGAHGSVGVLACEFRQRLAASSAREARRLARRRRDASMTRRRGRLRYDLCAHRFESDPGCAIRLQLRLPSSLSFFSSVKFFVCSCRNQGRQSLSWQKTQHPHADAGRLLIRRTASNRFASSAMRTGTRRRILPQRPPFCGISPKPLSPITTAPTSPLTPASTVTAVVNMAVRIATPATLTSIWGSQPAWISRRRSW